MRLMVPLWEAVGRHIQGYTPLREARGGIYRVIHPSGKLEEGIYRVYTPSGRLEGGLYTLYTPLREAGGRVIHLIHTLSEAGEAYTTVLTLRRLPRGSLCLSPTRFTVGQLLPVQRGKRPLRTVTFLPERGD